MKKGSKLMKNRHFDHLTQFTTDTAASTMLLVSNVLVVFSIIYSLKFAFEGFYTKEQLYINYFSSVRATCL